MKYVVAFCVGFVLGAAGMTLVSENTYKTAKVQTRTHIDQGVSTAASAAHNALQEGADRTASKK
jgi:hypothetical protein